MNATLRGWVRAWRRRWSPVVAGRSGGRWCGARSGTSDARAGEVGRAVRLGGDDVLDRGAGELAREARGRVADREVRGGDHAVGEPEQLADLRLVVAQQGRDRGADALVAQ